MKKRTLAAAGAGAALLTTFSALSVSSASASSGDVAVGYFHKRLSGVSAFVQSDTGVAVQGIYSGLRPYASYFTVIYANGNCDPAQAFPVGPFTANGRGVARLDTRVPGTVDVGGTFSVSVRRADTAADLDGDGKTGPTDVVAVAGTPGIGLVECNRRPRVLDQ